MAITVRQTMFDNASRGKGLTLPFLTASTGSTTSAAAASGSFSMMLMPNNIGTTLWSAVQGIPEPAGLPSPTRLTGLALAPNRGQVDYFGRFYKVGTLNLAATGDQFTHDAATFPILKNQMGASSALNLIPIMVVTTATTTTAAIFTIKTTGGAAGYKNQDGSSVIGTKTFTMPNVATALGSAFVLRLEDNDSAVQDITQISVGTAASAGAASIYLFECLAVSITPVGNATSQRNVAFNPVSLPNIAAGTATSGTATSALMFMAYGTAGAATQVAGVIKAYTE